MLDGTSAFSELLAPLAYATSMAIISLSPPHPQHGFSYSALPLKYCVHQVPFYCLFV